MPNIGIDFGTTNSVIVAYNKKKNEFTYFNFARGRGGAPIPTSSTVWYHDNLVEVGKNARDNINKYGDVEGHHFERSIKLKLGSGQNLNIFGASVKPYADGGTAAPLPPSAAPDGGIGGGLCGPCGGSGAGVPGAAADGGLRLRRSVGCLLWPSAPHPPGGGLFSAHHDPCGAVGCRPAPTAAAVMSGGRCGLSAAAPALAASLRRACCPGGCTRRDGKAPPAGAVRCGSALPVRQLLPGHGPGPAGESLGDLRPGGGAGVPLLRPVRHLLAAEL